jgi:hypothetical protein
MKLQAPNSKLQRSSKLQVSLTPGFSRVWRVEENKNRFNGLPRPANKLLNRFSPSVGSGTGLKPGVNESLKVLWLLELGIWSFDL